MRRPIHLILDWDGTLTRKDSLALVGQIAYHCNQHKPLPPWSDFVSAYINDYTRHLCHYKPESTARTTLDQERQWLASLTPIELGSVQRVEASNIFHGVTTHHVDHMASTCYKNGNLKLRDNWAFLFKSLLHPDRQNKISILSVNWSQRFIRQSLLAAATNDPSISNRETLTSYINAMEIRANEISNLDSPKGSNGKLTKDSSFSSSSSSTTTISTSSSSTSSTTISTSSSSTISGIRTSADKLANMPPSHRHNLDMSQKEDDGDEGDYTVIYVGDSATDLEALLAADVGVCVRDEIMGASQLELADALTRIGVLVVSIDEGIGMKQINNERAKVVYWAEGLEQIAKALTKD